MKGETRRTWNGFRVGDYIDRPLLPVIPDARIPDGKYRLQVINIKDTNTYKNGWIRRDFFNDRDDYDHHLHKIDVIKKGFNSKKRVPIIVFKFGDGYVLCDGHHRLIAAKELNKGEILAFVEPYFNDNDKFERYYG